MGSDLYKRAMAYYDEHDRDPALQHQVWDGTPWMVDAYTGRQSRGDDRYQEMMQWCYDRFGDPAWPFTDKPRPGDWRGGNATVFGWTWFGFKTEAAMNEFIEAWPAPENVAA